MEDAVRGQDSGGVGRRERALCERGGKRWRIDDRKEGTMEEIEETEEEQRALCGKSGDTALTPIWRAQTNRIRQRTGSDITTKSISTMTLRRISANVSKLFLLHSAFVPEPAAEQI